RADRARRREVRPARVRSGDGAVRRPAARRRPRRREEDPGPRLMATDVKLPRLGQGMESGTIVRWLKAEGESVEKGEPLYEVDTDKATQEVEAEASGVLLRIAVAEGEVAVGHTIAVIGSEGEAIPDEAISDTSELAREPVEPTAPVAEAQPPPPREF